MHFCLVCVLTYLLPLLLPILQTLNCLELWVKVLSAAAPRGTLAPLVYPLVQLLLGAARLVPTPRYFPIRLRLVRALNRLAQATGVYIPVSPLLLEMLQWSELRRTPTGGAGAAPDMLLLLRLSKQQLKTASVQEEVVNQVLELLADHLQQWATSISYPEASHLPCVVLRGFIKGCAVERFRRAVKQLVDVLERNMVYVGAARDQVNFAPQDLAAAARFMAEGKDVAKAPLVQFASQLRQKAQARMAMRSRETKELQLAGGAAAGGNKKRRRQQQEEESGDDEQGADNGDLANLMAAGDNPASEDEEALAGAAKKMIRQKGKRSKHGAGEQQQQQGGASNEKMEQAGGDQLAEYELSDDSNISNEGYNGYDSAGDDDENDEQEAAAAHGNSREQRGGRSSGGRHQHKANGLHKRGDGRHQQQHSKGKHKGQHGSRKGAGRKGAGSSKVMRHGKREHN
eukprot:GHRR01024347.1.p1 GENE.GHRR01024347.1~~GHRR01024347.1.p1  ORF type:complete len:457 (+),score=189.91 GHRR01024347.1:1293-2663(+)